MATRSKLTRSSLRRAGSDLSASSVASLLQASWGPVNSVARYYAISYTNGNDSSNVGYIDAAIGTVFTAAQLRAVAFKTIEQFLSVVPREGAGRRLVCLLEGDPAAAGPTSYFDKDGTTLSTIDMSGISGYTTFLMRASDFTNNAADQLRCATYVKQAGPGGGGRWTVNAFAAPNITVTSATLSTTFGTLEGCSLEFDGNITAALATKGGIVKYCSSSSVLNVGIGSSSTQTLPINGDTFLITAPSVKTGPVQGSQSNLSIGQSVTGATSRFPSSQFVGIEMANPGTYTNSAQLRVLCNQMVFSKCLWSGFTTGRFSSGDGFQFDGVYFNESGGFIETGHSFCFNGGASSTCGFTGLANVVPNGPSPTISSVVVLGSNATNGTVNLDGVFGSSLQFNSAILTRSAVHGILQCQDVRIGGAPNSDQAGVGGANGIYDQLLVRVRVAGDAVQILSGNSIRLANVAIGGGVDAVTNYGGNNFVEMINIVNADNVNSGYGLNVTDGVRAVQSRFVDGGGNTVSGTTGEILLDTGIALTWAGLTEGFQSVAGNVLAKRSQTIGAFSKITLGTVGNAPILGANPGAPANGDFWFTDIAGVRRIAVRIAGVTYTTVLV